MARIAIRNEDGLNEALDRVLHLAGHAKGGDEDGELAAPRQRCNYTSSGGRSMGADHGTNIGSGDLGPTEIGLVERLLEIIAVEGLVKPELLKPHAKVDDIGFTIDDLTLIGNAIEREYDCDMMPDEAMQRCKTVRELVELIGQRIQSAGNQE